jgi:hypothetical protein
MPQSSSHDRQQCQRCEQPAKPTILHNSIVFDPVNGNTSRKIAAKRIIGGVRVVV